MKIISKAELMALPPGTLFANYVLEPCGQSYLPWTTPPSMILDAILYRPLTGEPFDFYYIDFDSPEFYDTSELIDRCVDMADRGTSYPVDLNAQREGLYDPSLRYIVWEPEDVRRLVELLAPSRGANPRCQDTTTYPVEAIRRWTAWCELPADHAGMHRATLVQDGSDATFEWPRDLDMIGSAERLGTR